MPHIIDKRVKEEFKFFFLQNFPKVRFFALKILKSEEDAEDVAQEIFIKLWTLPEIWKDKKNIDGYMFIMVRNHIFNFIKQKKIKREQHVELSLNLEILHSDFDIQEELSAKELRLMINLAINKMPERRREIYHMSRIRGKSNKEISMLLKLSIRTVERHLYLALLDLRKIFS